MGRRAGLERQGPGLVTALAALGLTGWGLARPALWLDESATAMATARTWPHLGRLLHGTDAPLVPYYALLKAQRDLAVRLFPAAAGHPELLLRWPSALAVAVAGWVLVSWVRSAAGPVAAACSGAALLLVEGVSRYGQEARPYAIVMMLAVVSTATWWRLMRTCSPAATVGYAGCVAGMTTLHALSAALVVAHLLATLLIRRDELVMRILTGTCGALAGLLAAAPMTIAALVHGAGATRIRPISAAHLLGTFGSLIGGRPGLDGPVVLLLLLASAGLVRPGSDRDLAAVAAAWVVVPVLVLVPAMVLQPNLQQARYALFAVPGLAVLAGLGVRTLAVTAAGVGVAGVGFTGVGGRAARVAGLAAAVAVPLAVLTSVAALQWPTLSALRSPAGHGDDIRPALDRLDRAPDRQLPVLLATRFGAVEVGAYAPAGAALAARLVNVRLQADGPDIWPEAVPAATVRTALEAAPAVLLLARNPQCGPLLGPLGHRLADYRVSAVHVAPGRWVLYRLQLAPPLSPPRSALTAGADLFALPCPAGG